MVPDEDNIQVFTFSNFFKQAEMRVWVVKIRNFVNAFYKAGNSL